MKSCIYEGKVRHRRNAPTHHQFDFRMFMLMLDLDELKTVFSKRWFWSTSSMSLARFRQSDRFKSHSHLSELRDRAAAVLNDNGITHPLSSVQLLTQLRYLGFEMNPVCFYYCYTEVEPETAGLPSGGDPDEQSGERAERIIAIIAEVNNTPWGEQHNYVIHAKDFHDSLTRHNSLTQNNSRQANIKSPPIEKTFHVSPFMDMNMDYRMAFSLPGEKLAVTIKNHLRKDDRDKPTEISEGGSSIDSNRSQKKILEVAMLLDRTPLRGANLNWMLFKYPLISFKTFAAIYFQAWRLYLKKVPFFSHPKKMSSVDLEKIETEINETTTTASGSAMVSR